jgi:hypothetical protein
LADKARLRQRQLNARFGKSPSPSMTTSHGLTALAVSYVTGRERKDATSADRPLVKKRALEFGERGRRRRAFLSFLLQSPAKDLL